jgi:WD40 repeat protein
MSNMRAIVHTAIWAGVPLLLGGILGCARAPEPPYGAEGSRVLEESSGPVFALAFSPDGTKLGTGAALWDGSDDKNPMSCVPGEIKLWDVETAKVSSTSRDLIDSRAKLNTFVCLAFTRDGKGFISGGLDTRVRLYSDAEGHAIAYTTYRTFWKSRDNDGPSMSGGGDAWGDLGDGPAKKLKEKRVNQVWQFALSPDSKLGAVSAGTGGTVVEGVDFFDESHKLDTILKPVARGPKGYASCIAYAPNGKSVASGGAPDKLVNWWQPNPGNEPTMLATFKHDAPVIRVAFTPDGKALAAGDDGGVLKLWDLETKKERHTIKAHQGDVGALAVSPDGKVVATGGPDKVIKLWDVATGKEIASRPNQKGRIQALAFSPSGKTLASSACDPFEKGEVRLSEVAKLVGGQ